MLKNVIFIIIAVVLMNTYAFANEEIDETALAKQYIKMAGDDPANEKAFGACTEKLMDLDWRHGFRVCSEVEIERLKRIMNKTYAKILRSKISLEQKQKIEKAQRAWLSYTKQFDELNELFLSRSGTSAEGNLYMQNIDHLRFQIKILKDLYEEIQVYIEGAE